MYKGVGIRISYDKTIHIIYIIYKSLAIIHSLNLQNLSSTIKFHLVCRDCLTDFKVIAFKIAASCIKRNLNVAALIKLIYAGCI